MIDAKWKPAGALQVSETGHYRLMLTKDQCASLGSTSTAPVTFSETGAALFHDIEIWTTGE